MIEKKCVRIAYPDRLDNARTGGPPSKGAMHSDGKDIVDIREAPGLSFWLIILTILLCLTALISFCVCCAVRCFSPENTLGPAWEHNTNGSRFVRPLGHDSWWGGWLGHGAQYDESGKERVPRLSNADATKSSGFAPTDPPSSIRSVR